MSNIASKLFCCFPSNQTQPKPKTEKESAKNFGPPAKAPSKNEIRVSDAQPINAPATTSSVTNTPNNANTSMPLEYINPGEPDPEELAIKPRRESVSVIANSQPVADEALNETIEPNFNDEADYEFEDLLPPISLGLAGRKCLVLDLDETLVHSSFKYIWNADFVIPVEIEGTVHDVHVVKRPGVDEFLKAVSQFYEVVVFTASVSKYGDPLLDRLDPHKYIHHRLFRESCYYVNGSYIKNLAWLGRPLNDIIIIDNSPAAYILQPFNAVPVSSWFSDIHDNELLDMLPILEDLASKSVPDVSRILQYEW